MAAADRQHGDRSAHRAASGFGRRRAAGLAQRLLDHRDTIAAHIEANRHTDLDGFKIRLHGDLHLGQVLLAKDCVTAEKRVASLIQITLTPNQFSALVSFEFNTGALGSSPALALINQHQGADAWENHLCLYVHGGNGEVLEGLVRRRAAEYALWNTH